MDILTKTWTPREINAVLDRVLLTVEKPGRYTGGEHNQVVNNWEAAPLRVALAFPDIYDLGMSNLGLATLYDILNRRAGILCERVYCPWSDMEAVMRREGLPLYSLETHHPLSQFDLIGISLPYEQLYSNVLNLLDLAGVPVRAAERDATHPIVLAGGHATYNAEPMADFIDAFAIGEGEEVIVEVARCIEQWKREGGTFPIGSLAPIGPHRGYLRAEPVRCDLSSRWNDRACTADRAGGARAGK